MNVKHDILLPLYAKHVFIFVSIITINIYISRFFNITLSTVLFLVIALIMCCYVYYYKQDLLTTINDTSSKDIDIDVNIILEKLKLYSNLRQYNKIKKNIIAFVDIYNTCIQNDINIFYKTQKADSLIKLINTNLSEIIYSTSDVTYINNLTSLSSDTTILLTKYLNIITTKCNNSFNLDTNIEKHYYDNGVIKESNYFDNQNDYE